MNSVVHYSQLPILAVLETAKSSVGCPDLQRHYFLSDMATVHFLDVLFSSQGLSSPISTKLMLILAVTRGLYFYFYSSQKETVYRARKARDLKEALTL